MMESELQTRVMEAIKKLYSDCYLLNTCMRYAIGVPDLMIGENAKLITIELKVARKNPCTIQSLFPKSRKQIPTMFEIEKAKCKAYGLILFEREEQVMLFRIDFARRPITEYENLDFINRIELRPIIENPETYYRGTFKEVYIEPLSNLLHLMSFLTLKP